MVPKNKSLLLISGTKGHVSSDDLNKALEIGKQKLDLSLLHPR